MSAPFADGDVVRLKSGGPLMTVESFDEEGGTAICVWYDADYPGLDDASRDGGGYRRWEFNDYLLLKP